MLKERFIDHKRKNSQIDLFYPQHQVKTIQAKQQPSKTKPKKLSNDNKKVKLSLERKSQHLHSKNVLKLIQNSQKKATCKETCIQSIDFHNNWPTNNENFDHSNQSIFQNNSENKNDQNGEEFFQFGKKVRNFIAKNEGNETNYGSLNMEQITEVPDTMSNQRRYDQSNFYQFSLSHQTNLDNDSCQLLQEQKTSKKDVTRESRQAKNLNLTKGQEQKKNLKKRKEKLPKNIVIEGQSPLQKLNLSELHKENTRSKIFLTKFSKKEDRKSKSRQNLKKSQKQKSFSSLLLTKKSKSISQAMLRGRSNKKSLSLKNEDKDQKDKLPKKQKLFQKQKDPFQHKFSHQFYSKRQKQVRPTGRELGINNPKSVQIGRKITMIEQSQSKLHNQYKVLWQCVGQLWENNRITRYISEKNKSDIFKIKETEKLQDEKMIKLKSQILNSISSARY